MIKIKIKYILYLLLGAMFYYLFSHLEIVTVKTKRTLIDIVHSQDRSGTTVYVNYLWKEDGCSYVERESLESFNANLQKGKTYIHESQTLTWK